MTKPLDPAQQALADELEKQPKILLGHHDHECTVKDTADERLAELRQQLAAIDKEKR